MKKYIFILSLLTSCTFNQNVNTKPILFELPEQIETQIITSLKKLEMLLELGEKYENCYVKIYESDNNLRVIFSMKSLLSEQYESIVEKTNRVLYIKTIGAKIPIMFHLDRFSNQGLKSKFQFPYAGGYYFIISRDLNTILDEGMLI